MTKVSELLHVGHTLEAACGLFKLSRSTWYRHENAPEAFSVEKTALLNAPGLTIVKVLGPDDQGILDHIRSLLSQHPYWGYRRVHANLKCRKGLKVNRKRVYRLMKENELLGHAKRYKPQRTFRTKPVATRPNEIWGTDMTKFLIPSLGWIPLVIVLDWYTKRILGYAIGLRGDTTLWLQALDQACLAAFPVLGPRDQGVKLVSDNGSQPTSRRYLNDCKSLGIEQIFTSYDNPKGNADTERVIRTLKEEAIWPYEFATLEEAKEKIDQAIAFYNQHYCHSTLGYLSPMEFLQAYLVNHPEQKAA
jgi:transposase InsO family protein